MQLADVNVLLNAFRSDVPDHARYRHWLHDALARDERFATSELILSAVVRLLTNRRVDNPDDLETALGHAEFIRGQPTCVIIAPGPRHWEIFANLCRALNIRGGRITDAYLAALAIEHGCEWISSDQQFAQFPGLRWRDPFA